ncbi:MAG TPA: hypothetical protein VFV72_09990 [Candidatus Limnocylindrales bacterium]|nr:hypothetical protein [Candidatus Limnocylindrales bacterium]
MNAVFDGARIHQQELDREIESLYTERMLNSRSPRQPGPVARGLASVGRGLISVGTALASRVDGPATSRSTATGGRA